MEKWSELPPEILHSISLRIDNPFDLIHFWSVCSSWRSCSLLFRPKTSLICPLLVYSSGYGDDRYILSRSVYLLKSSDLNGPRYWLFKLQEKENGDIVLHSLFLRRNTDEDRYSYPTFSLDLLRCQVFELAQEHVACYSEWSEPCEGKVERRIGFMSLDAESNEFMVLGRLPFKGPAVYRSIDGRWTELQITQPVSFEGIVSYKSKFYAIDLTGRTIVVEPTLQLHTFQRSRPSYKARKRWANANVASGCKAHDTKQIKHWLRLLNSGDKVLLVEMCTERRADFFIPNIREKEIWFEVSELDVERND
ncbi:hypothetical protein YC2023_086324 [Brassica napus]